MHGWQENDGQHRTSVNMLPRHVDSLIIFRMQGSASFVEETIPHAGGADNTRIEAAMRHHFFKYHRSLDNDVRPTGFHTRHILSGRAF
jgi:hypothetical protein